MARFSRKWNLLLSALAGLGALGATSQVATANRTINSLDGFPNIISFPLTSSVVVELDVLRAAAGARVHVGFERIQDEPLPERVIPRPLRPEQVDLAGQPLGQVLDRLTKEAPPLRRSSPPSVYQFTWKEDEGVISVTPLRGQPSFLDSIVPSIELKDTTLPAAATVIHRLFDAQSPDTSRAADELPRVFMGTQDSFLEKRRIFKRTLSISLRNATVREVLNALVKAHGEASWVVIYSDSTLTYQNCDIAFAAFNGARIDFGARRQR